MKRFARAAILVAIALVACDQPTSPLRTIEAGPPNARMSGQVVTNAVYTIVNDSADGPGTCFNGPADNIQNCNIYAAKENVWLGGKSVHGPTGLANGTYFFAVLQPGGQQDPNDGFDHVLSDVSPTTNTGAGDSYENRTFSLVDGVIHYHGTHSFGSNKLRLFPYDDTPNPGGEYIMAVCSLANGYPVTPSDCKYDAFKVKVSTPAPCTENCGPASLLTATKTAAGTNDRTYRWSIAKTVDRTVLTSATGSATFNYTVTVTRDDGTPSNVHVTGTIAVNNPNDGYVAIAGITDVLSDGTACSVSNAPASLAPGTTTLAYSCDLQNLPAQPLDNTARVSWASQQVNGHSLDDGSAVATVNGIQFTETAIDASVNVTDTFGQMGPASATGTFTYSKTFDNNAAGTCTSHDNTATLTTSDTHATGSASQSVKVCVGANLTAMKTAAPSYSRKYAWEISKTVDKTVVKQAGSSATFNYTVGIRQADSTDSDWLVSGAITVNNPNDWEAITTDISDAISNGGDCAVSGGSNVTIAAQGSVTRGYTCSYGSAPIAAYTNTATASWDAAAAATPSNQATGLASGAFGDPTRIIDGSINVTDTFGEMGAASANGTFTYSKTFDNNPAGTCTDHDNTATFTTSDTHATGSASQSVKVCVGANLTAIKTAAPSYSRKYAWGISKAVDKTVVKQAGSSATFDYTVNVTQTGSTDSDWLVSGSITVNNPNDWEAVTTDISDAISNGGDCSVSGGSSVTVPASSSVTRGYTCSYTSAPTAAFTNRATASWDSDAASTSSNSATGLASGAFGEPTTIIDGSVSLTDTYADLGSASGTQTFTYSKTFDNNAAGTCTAHDNTATFTTSDTHSTGSASQSVKVCVGANLTASKTAAPSFIRTYAWGITKAVDKTVVKQVGGSATFTYTVKAAQTGSTDSGWLVTGTITVNNPNDWEAVTANISDAINNGGTCAVSGGSSVTIPASGTVTRGYTCSYASGPSAAYTNTATASWDAAAAATSSSSATGLASGAFSAPTTVVNGSVSVQDQFNGWNATTLGSLAANYATPASGSWTYTHTMTVVANACNTFNNTATYTTNNGATGSASRSVLVCGNVAGGLTMGFWQNKNGQAIITGGLASSGVCNSATWLRVYAPDRDLSATATCAQVATYVFNIVKAANASGAAMNAMLKSQMLATSLDVYFSTASLGGNKIAAPAALGGIRVDLTMVCPVIGTTCSGGYRSSSPAFGGATSMTVSEALAYAASQSNSGGSLWYAQDKTVQEMAKNVFDAINNAVALAAL